jgi:hypothetical protein
MKIKHILLSLIAFVSLYLSACQKDFKIDDNIVARVDSTIIPSAGDSNYLDRIIMRDTSILNGNTMVDSSAFVFYYDIQKRLSLVTFKSLTNANDSDIYLKPYYNQNDSLPYKVYFTPDSSTYYFYYDNVGRLIKDSVENVFGAGLSGVRNLNYSGNKIYAQLFLTSNLALPIEKDTFTLDTRGNMINSKYYVKSIGAIYELASSTNATFDNGSTPYLKTPGFRIFSFSFGTFHYEAYYNNFGANNILVDSYIQYPYTGVTTVSPPHISSVINTYYQNGLLKNLKNSNHENWTYIYKSL